jgi:TPR repeat protein
MTVKMTGAILKGVVPSAFHRITRTLWCMLMSLRTAILATLFGGLLTFGSNANAAHMPSDPDVAQIRALAEKGAPEAESLLGSMYRSGRWGIPKDQALAVKWWRKAAEAGEPIAACHLGGAYLYGRGVPVDVAEGVKWLTKAAEGGIARAQWTLGNYYSGGEFVPHDAKEAVKWWEKAAAQGFVKAQVDLGISYVTGAGGTRDYQKALPLLQQAANKGDSMGQYSLGNVYHEGLGVPADKKAAIRWWREAAEQDNGFAALRLADAYATGDGVTRNPVEAYKWYDVASASGSRQADASQELLVGSMSAEDLRKAKDLTSHWEFLRVDKKMANDFVTPQ